MNRLRNVLSVCRLCSVRNPNLLKFNARTNNLQYQSSLNYSELPKMKKPGEGKGPISWKSLKYLVGGSTVLLCILKYMEMRKDAGNINLL